ncbi:hypothetical protein DM860_016676 [Cuscuta australis]|uniref:Uncharacterized protein n=1 Tax=Cuscuta australis TaxID=267555 RepID=A0A328DQH0_9ASTE|nr:hypothetical protein DM860_016676 [Cuscuta australis]
MARKDPTMLPPTSGKTGNLERGFTLPFRSTWTGYFMRCPLISVTSSAANCCQLVSPIDLMRLTHSKDSGRLKQSSTTPKCSAQRDILYP